MARKRMNESAHTNESALADVSTTRENTMHTAETESLGDVLNRALRNIENELDKEENKMTNVTTVTATPEAVVSNVHTSNTLMRLESEQAILRDQINGVDAKIAVLQAERTDLMKAYAINQAGINVGESM